MYTTYIQEVWSDIRQALWSQGNGCQKFLDYILCTQLEFRLKPPANLQSSGLFW